MLTVSLRTHPGTVRTINEDTVLWDPGLSLLAVADGMGGHNAGEVASRLAIETIRTFLEKSAESHDCTWPFGVDVTVSLEMNRLRTAVRLANRRIFRESEERVEYTGMGTTVVAALFYDNRISIAHVGDSRLYRQRGSQISQVTMDHSLLQELVDRGFYSPEEAQRAANKNYVTRALGVEPQVEVEVQEHPVDKGDIFILCSDGLSDMVEDEDIRLTISTFGANLDTVAKQLIQLANENGGRDNVSVVLAQAIEAFPASRGVMDKLLGWFS